MNHRREQRTPLKPQLVTVTILEPEIPALVARLSNYCPVGLQLITDQEVPVGRSVKVQWGGALILGEIIYCRSADDSFYTGVEVKNLVFDSD